MDSKLILEAARGTLDVTLSFPGVGSVHAEHVHSAGSLLESHQPWPAHQAEASGFLFRRKDLTRATDCFFRAAVRTSDMASSPPPTRGMNAAPLTAAAAYLGSPNRVTSNMQPTPLFGGERKDQASARLQSIQPDGHRLGNTGVDSSFVNGIELFVDGGPSQI